MQRKQNVHLTNDFDVVYLPDGDFSDGLDRETFEEAVIHVVTVVHKLPQTVADFVLYCYTDWSNVTDPLTNRKQYVQVIAQNHISSASPFCKSETWIFQPFHLDCEMYINFHVICLQTMG